MKTILLFAFLLSSLSSFARVSIQAQGVDPQIIAAIRMSLQKSPLTCVDSVHGWNGDGLTAFNQYRVTTSTINPGQPLISLFSDDRSSKLEILVTTNADETTVTGMDIKFQVKVYTIKNFGTLSKPDLREIMTVELGADITCH